MEKLRWLMNSFGFSIRQLAYLLDTSATQLHNMISGQRSLNASVGKALEDPLFTPYPVEVEDKELSWFDPDPDQRMQAMTIRRLDLSLRMAALEKKITAMKTRNRNLQRLLRHTDHLPLTPAGGENLMVKWWILQRAKASLALRDFTRKKLDEMQIEQAKMKAEFALLEIWLGEAGS